jgi:hypothetical protein
MKNEKKIRLPINDPICAMMMQNFDSSFLRRKPWSEKLKVIDFERNDN